MKNRTLCQSGSFAVRKGWISAESLETAKLSLGIKFGHITVASENQESNRQPNAPPTFDTARECVYAQMPCGPAPQAAESLISHDEPFSAEEKAQSRDIKKSINLNLAAAHLKLNEHSDAIAAASKVRWP